jgi:hypothetical protein
LAPDHSLPTALSNNRNLMQPLWSSDDRRRALELADRCGLAQFGMVTAFVVQ